MSGRNSCAGIPVAASTARTRSAGIRPCDHLVIADLLTPMARATSARHVPFRLIAVFRSTLIRLIVAQLTTIVNGYSCASR